MQVIPYRALVAGVLAIGVMCWTPLGPAAAQSNPDNMEELQPPRALASALNAARDGDWDLAHTLAGRDGAVAQDYIEWTRLRSGRGSVDEVLTFLDRNAHWPGLDYLRKQNEAAFEDATDAEVRALFADARPGTGTGALRLARALETAGEVGEAEATIVLAWRTLDLTAEEHAAFMDRYGELLKDHHAARLSEAIWQDRDSDTQRMLGVVSDDDAKLARARLALQARAGNVDALIDDLSADQLKDPGLAYDRFFWRYRKGLNDGAKELMRSQSAIPGGLGYPEKWANLRRSYARGEMRSGDPQIAYELAANHQLTTGSSFADLEWLAGYIALTYLDDAERALMHFEQFEDGIYTPISLGRAGYWRGRALEALERPEDAEAAYRDGAAQQTSFYGLLAAEKINMPFGASLAGMETVPDWSETALADSDLRQAVILLRSAGYDYDAERFLKHMAETATETELNALGQMVEEAGDPHLQVMLGKAAAQRTIVIPRHYYALHPMTQMELPVSMEMALAIARRESEFDPGVTSPVGARGLMQLMPATAREMARKIGDADDVAGRLGDWDYNAKLGSAYLAQLVDQFSGNVLMISAGYNAGPSRPERWAQQFGDPRDAETDVVDWIEHIPFRETRNYVQRVAESLPIYRARLGQTPLPVPFTTEIKGSTVAAFPPQGE
ncbi:lytic transglycosylase domain-containing protein [Pseudooceanicola sp. MF1-13]|uniref:lytic transglycosylase domain-containing protein n=1 Tax=Pseudooceanicola sp. MF1-13 TaxID=3379095 RepID=UPI0038917BDC